jgi:flavin reductase (DIM6/NTAB) family NADH-FMN oxidoreductase RutF
MSHFASQARQALKRIAFGDTNLPQQCTVGFFDPQTQVRVWLHGSGAPRDVTHNHVVACAAPFTIAIGSDVGNLPAVDEKARLSLRFEERGGNHQLLGTIALHALPATAPATPEVRLFSLRSSRNHCLPRARLLAHNLHQAYLQASSRKNSQIPIAASEVHAMGVSFICPRPVVLVSVKDEESGNIFPMNLMGPIGNGYFAFALNSSRQAAPLVERAGRVALSSVPIEQAPLARQLGANHWRESLNWNQLPFPLQLSTALQIPVPCFAPRVRKMEIKGVRQMGSHTLFIATMIRDECFAHCLQFFMIHGTYQC